MFTLDYWWKAVRDQPKWANRSDNQDLHMSKRVKHTESGAYTSSTQDNEEVEPHERSEGQKKAKDRLKGKETKCCQEGEELSL